MRGPYNLRRKAKEYGWGLLNPRVVLDILVQPRRDQVAAETFLLRVLAPAGSEPRVVITDKPASYPPALRRVLTQYGASTAQGLNNRAENSH